MRASAPSIEKSRSRRPPGNPPLEGTPEETDGRLGGAALDGAALGIDGEPNAPKKSSSAEATAGGGAICERCEKEFSAGGLEARPKNPGD